MALAALALVVFGAIECPPKISHKKLPGFDPLPALVFWTQD